MISIDSVCKSYSSSERTTTVFQDFSLSIEPGTITAVLGPSGCGKSTLLHLLSALEEPDGGRISGIPTDPVTSRLSVSYLFQQPRLLPWRRVGENIDIVLQRHEADRTIRQERVKRFLSLVGLSDAASLYPQELSGGMRQRVSLARAFAFPSQVILMDEPFQSLDADLRFNLVEVYRRLWETEQRTTILVTHEIWEALLLASRIIILSDAPARILSQWSVDIPLSQRSLSNPDLMALQANYYENFCRRG